MGDLKNPRLIYLKGWLFLGVGCVSATLLLMRRWDWQDAMLLAICVWAFCRVYYFAFYVIEHYVEPGYHYAGIWDFLQHLRRRRGGISPKKSTSNPEDS